MMKLRDLYKVETLDDRFASKTGEPLPNAQPSRWRTPEYLFYYFCFLTIPFFMVKSVYDVSRPEHPGYVKYEKLLSNGWIPGRKVDNSDLQYKGFRDNIPYMALVLILHPIARRVYEHLAGGNSQARTVEQSADARLKRRTSFDLVFAIIYIIALHGASAPKIFVILCFNYQIATRVPKQFVTPATWAFNIATLFANELCHGYRYADMLVFVTPSSHHVPWEDFVYSPTGAYIDQYLGGLVPRWEVLFNITVLRLIAYNLDYLWSRDRGASSPLEKKNLDPANLSERDRVALGAKASDYNIRNYLAYTLYSPLYLAGPIVNFNDYIAQSRYRLPTLTWDRVTPYAIRFAVCLLTMELAQHFLYAVAISKAQPDWSLYTPFQLSMLGYFNLHLIWLKLLLPWRFFRLWSLVDGIDPPENMVRCMSDNYSVLAFWRGWHRSFNRWIVRYIFVPMGGSGRGIPQWRAALNYLSVFTFVALWHDINLRLLIWGWLIVLFVLPEVLARMAFPAKNYKNQPDLYRWLSGIGAVGNILMLMVANLVGFAVGLDGLKGLVDGIIGSLGGRVFLVAACATLFVGVQVMFEWREAERRRGVNMKC